MLPKAVFNLTKVHWRLATIYLFLTDLARSRHANQFHMLGFILSEYAAVALIARYTAM